MPASDAWLRRFPAAHQGLIGHYFYEAIRKHAGSDPALICSELAKHLWEQRRAHGPGLKVDQADILEAMRSDPDGAVQFGAWCIEREARSHEEKARDREYQAEAGKLVGMEMVPPTLH